MYTQFLFDVTNTSTHKVSFTVEFADTSLGTQGNTNINLTHVTFQKLGDT